MADTPHTDRDRSLEDALARSDWMRDLARRLVGAGDADDLVQEAWLVLLRSGPSKPEAFRAWIAGVLRGRARTIGRSNRRRSKREALASHGARPGPSPAEAAETLETHRVLNAAVGRLPDAYLAVVVARYHEGRSTAEIARAEGIAESSVRARLSRAVSMLREDLDGRFRTRGERLIGVATLFYLAYPEGTSAAEWDGLIAAPSATAPVVASGGAGGSGFVMMGSSLGVTAALVLGIWFALGSPRAEEPTPRRTSLLAPAPTGTSPAPATEVGGRTSENSAPHLRPRASGELGAGGLDRPTPHTETPIEELPPLPDSVPPIGKSPRSVITAHVAYTVPIGFRGTGAVTLALPDGTVLEQWPIRCTSRGRAAGAGSTVPTEWQIAPIAVDLDRLTRDWQKKERSADDGREIAALDGPWILVVDLEGRSTRSASNAAVRTGAASVLWASTHPAEVPLLIEVPTVDVRTLQTLRLPEEFAGVSSISMRRGHEKARVSVTVVRDDAEDPGRVFLPAHRRSATFRSRTVDELIALGGTLDRKPVDSAEPARELSPTRSAEQALARHLPRTRTEALHYPVSVLAPTLAERRTTAFAHLYTRSGKFVASARNSRTAHSADLGDRAPGALEPLVWTLFEFSFEIAPDPGPSPEPWLLVIDTVTSTAGRNSPSPRDRVRSGSIDFHPMLGHLLEGHLLVIPTATPDVAQRRSVPLEGRSPRWSLGRKTDGAAQQIISSPTASGADPIADAIPHLAEPELLEVSFIARDRHPFVIPFLEVADGAPLPWEPAAIVDFGRLLVNGRPDEGLTVRLMNDEGFRTEWPVRAGQSLEIASLPPGTLQSTFELHGTTIHETTLHLDVGENDRREQVPQIHELTRVVRVQLLPSEGEAVPSAVHVEIPGARGLRLRPDEKGWIRLLVPVDENREATVRIPIARPSDAPFMIPLDAGDLEIDLTLESED